MKVSIIVPAYNAEKYLSKSLDSIINQVYKNLEIIVIDDASDDNTKAVIKKYAEKDDRIIPFYQTQNKGVSAARNMGLKAATGDYIMFVDSDDELTKDAIRRMVDLKEKYNSDFIDSYHLLYFKKKNGKVVSFTEKKVPKEVLVLGSIEDDERVLSMNTYVTGKLIKRELLKDLNFDEDLRRYEDLVFEHQVKQRVKNYVFMNKTIYFYYQREDSLVNTLGKKHMCYLDAAKQVKTLYSDYDKKIKDEIEATLFQTYTLTLFTKVIKNDDTDLENANLVYEELTKLIELFPEYKENMHISKLIKSKLDKLMSDKKKLEKFVRKMRKKNFINIYFNWLSFVNKYEIKNPLK